MKYIPILFSTPMVQALLNKSKTMTRRVVKIPDEIQFADDWQIQTITEGMGGDKKNDCDFEIVNGNKWLADIRCPYGRIGEILWVRETFGYVYNPIEKIVYKTDVCSPKYDKPITGWKPCIHMPKTACRLFLKITNIRVERLQDIREGDASKEGIRSRVKAVPPYDMVFQVPDNSPNCYDTARKAFDILWESINGRGSWHTNPWVWVIEFERVEKPIDFI